MKIKLHPYLHKIVSKHFALNHLPKIVFPLEKCSCEPVLGPFWVSQSSFRTYWHGCLTAQHRKQSLCFFMPELIDLVNKTNSRLLYDDLVKSLNVSKREASDDADQYQLLNTFEMLWNVDKTSPIQEQEEDKKSFKGHALTVKEEFLESDKLV